MRSPHRIKPFTEALAAVWSCYPDERFGQFVMNLTRNEKGEFEDPWNWEDGDWQRRLQRRWDEALSDAEEA